MIDEEVYDDHPKPAMGVRSAVIASLDGGMLHWNGVLHGLKNKGPTRWMKDAGTLLRYGIAFGMCGPRKRRTIVDVAALVEKWVEVIVGMSTAHDKDAYDAADGKTDELLAPLLTAPVKQVREFYFTLLERLKADPRVPLLVWMGFDAWHECMVKDAPDEGIKRLKNKLAKEIAELVEEPIRDQIPGAIARALRWRDEKTLRAVKNTLEKGVKPKLRGRESCLFLEAGQGKHKVSVML